jgi:hypothetical protein
VYLWHALIMPSIKWNGIRRALPNVAQQRVVGGCEKSEISDALAR